MDNFFAAMKFDETGKLVWNKQNVERLAQYGKDNAGKAVSLQISELSPLRSDEHMGMLRIRFRDLKKYTGYTTAELMHLFFRACGLGHKLEDPKATAFHKFFIQDFERMSTSVMTRDDVKKVMNKLEEFRVWFNDTTEPELHWEWSPYRQPMRKNR